MFGPAWTLVAVWLSCQGAGGEAARLCSALQGMGQHLETPLCLCRVDISDTLMYVYEMLGAELLSSLYDKLGRLLTNTEQPSTWQVSKQSWHWAAGCQPCGGAPEGAVLAVGERRGVMDTKNMITLTCGLSEICWNKPRAV